MQVLGSGGPITEGRASSGYLVWVGGRARLLVDAGPGTAMRMAEAGADMRDLEAVLLTHLHVDHSADLLGLLKSASFGDRDAPLPVLGPTAGGDFPGVRAFLSALLGEGGAYPYLGYLGEDPPFPLTPRELDVSSPEAAQVLDAGPIEVRAVGVPHGPVPALAYEVRVEGRRVVFMGDQRADEARYVAMIRGADLLVAHMAIGDDSSGAAAALHAPPARLGEAAAEAGVGSMVLSHLMRRSLDSLDANLASIRARYEGPVTVANDGDCFPLR